MDMRVILATLLILVTAFCGLWDVIAVSKGNINDTVSRTLQDWSLMYPVLPLALGVVLGHIFWPVSPVRILGRE